MTGVGGNMTPILTNPLTDLFGFVTHHQQFGRCADFEMAMVNCMEAYGGDRGKVKCKDLIDDFYECSTLTKQTARENAMRIERHRQVLAGERKWDEHYEKPPKLDSY